MKEIAKRRKSFLPALIIAAFFWGTWLFILFKIAPYSWPSFVIFYLFLFLAIFFTAALLLGNSRRGLLTSLGLIGLLLLKQIKLANVLNIALLLTSIFSLEIYFTRR